VIAKGKTQNGTPFVRTFPRTFVARPVRVRFLENDSELVAGKTFRARVVVENVLDVTKAYRLSVSNDVGFPVTLSNKELVLKGVEKRIVGVEIKVPADAQQREAVTLTAIAAPLANSAHFNSDVLEVSLELDHDGDGASDTMEQGAEGSDVAYDGNGDGSADWKQSNVASFFSNGMHTYVTLTSPVGTALKGVSSNIPQHELVEAEGLALPLGAVRFRLEGIRPKGEIELAYYLPFAVSGYVIQVPNASGADKSSWEALKKSKVTGNVVRFVLRDDAQGDAEPEATVIAHTGGPTLTPTAKDDGCQVVEHTTPNSGFWLSVILLLMHCFRRYSVCTREDVCNRCCTKRQN